MYLCCVKQKTAYDMRMSDWSSDVCSSDLAPCMSGEDDAGGAIDLTTFGIINLDDVRRSEEFTADAAGIAVDDIAAVASDLERCAHGEEVRDQIIGLALHQDRKSTRLNSSH